MPPVYQYNAELLSGNADFINYIDNHGIIGAIFYCLLKPFEPKRSEKFYRYLHVRTTRNVYWLNRQFCILHLRNGVLHFLVSLFSNTITF